GKGGRNQEASLASYKYVDSNTIFISIGTDGWDNSDFAGGIMDDITIKKANKLGLVFDDYINNDDSYNFFKKTGDAIITGKLPSNVSDLMIVLKRR
ncbi:MAG: MOFRL family protein, partial [Patescibacteria group bacterium]